MTLETPTRSTDRPRCDAAASGARPHHRPGAVATAAWPSRSRSPTSVRPVSARSRSTYDLAVVPDHVHSGRHRAPRARDLAVPRAAAGRRGAGAVLAVGSTPLIDADRLAPALGIDRLWIKDDTRNPSLSFKDRAVAIAAARAVEFGVDGARLRLDRQPRRRHGRRGSRGRAPGLRLHPGRSRAGQGRPRAGLRRDRRPDRRDVRRRQPPVPRGRRRDRLGLRQHQPPAVLRRGLQDARVRDRRTARLALARRRRRRRSPRARCSPGSPAGFEELAELGLIERRPIRFVGGQAAGCAPVATAWAAGPTSSSRSGRPTRSSARSPSATRPTAATSWSSRAQWRLDRGDRGRRHRGAIRDVARLEGIYPETAGGVTLAAAAAARRRGVIRDGDEVVALLTGNGLKTPDARTLGLRRRRRSRARAARACAGHPAQPVARSSAGSAALV